MIIEDSMPGAGKKRKKILLAISILCAFPLLPGMAARGMFRCMAMHFEDHSLRPYNGNGDEARVVPRQTVT